MDDLISRQAALDMIHGTFSKSLARQRAEECIKKVPSAQKNGQWMPDNNNYFVPYFVCSHCHASYRVDTVMGHPTWKYCPNCGAYMRDEDDE